MKNTHSAVRFATKQFCPALVAALVALVPTPGVAAPPMTCLGPAIGVPANGTPPHWWDNNPPQSPYATKLDDPRWVGAGSVTFGDGTSNIVDFRGLQDANFIYLSWRMRHVVVGTSDNSILYFAIQDPLQADTGQNTVQNLIVKVDLKQNNSQEDQPAGAIADLTTSLRQGDGTGLPLNPRPTWLTDTLRVWTNNPDANSWGVEVRIPRPSLSPSGPQQFKMWFQVLTGTVGMPVAPLVWPTGTELTQTVSGDVYPDPANWRPFQFSTGPADPQCATAGVSLTWDQIGTHNVDPHQISLISPNTFFAHPQNNSGVDLTAGQILARFRIADWGSNPMGWEAGVDPNVLWSTIPGGDSVPNIGTIPNNTLATNANENHFNWTVSGADLTAFQNGTRLLHQCMLVELSSPVNIQFANDSIRRNMDFVNASKFERSAKLTIKGLQPIAPDGRDIYVWVETLNMPKQVQQGGNPPQLRTTVPSQPIAGGGDVNALAARRGAAAVVQNPPTEGKPIPVPNGDRLEAMLAAGEVTPEQIEEVVPTYIAHVYHDTGKTLRLGGTDRPVVVAQGSFGYFVSHQGALYGWEHQLVGQGVAVEKLAPDFYRIRKVPNAGTVTVMTTIMALESAPSILPWWWWIALLVVLAIFLLWLLMRKK